LGCAVLDPLVVANHQNNLWQLLFSSPPSSPINIAASGSGQAFLTNFQGAISSGNSFLIEDEYYYSRRVSGLPAATDDFVSYSTPASWPAPPGYYARAVPSLHIPMGIIEPSSLKHDFPSDPSPGEIGHPLGLDVISQYLTTPSMSTTYRS
jgi:hypothetical protein